MVLLLCLKDLSKTFSSKKPREKMVLTKRNRIIILYAFGGFSAREFGKKGGGMDRKGVSLEDRQEGRVSGLHRQRSGALCIGS